MSRAGRGATLVGAGIFASRIAGLAREMVAGRVIGINGAADALAAAMRIPNLLQNLLGEGVLSASFVPVYSELLDADDEREASRVAGAVGAALMVVTGLSVLAIVLAARPLTRLLAWGLTDTSFELAVDLTRITAVGIGFMVMSAWCLGILNSHRNFFLPYVAPVIWNVAQIAALLLAWQGGWDIADATRAVAIGVAVGGALQLLVQLPTTMTLARNVRLALDSNNLHVREVRRRFGPAVLGRGAVQISAYIDLLLASFLAAGALSALFKAQILYILPVSLFAMSVAAAELPELSRLVHDPAQIAQRTNAALRRIAFWMLASSLVLIAAGEPIVALLFEGGAFTSADTSLVWLILVFYGLGLPAIGLSRILQNAAYAMGDTAGPARLAALRVSLAAAFGVLFMFPLDRAFIGIDGVEQLGEAFGLMGPLEATLRSDESVVRLGAVGLAVGSAIGAWVELVLLSRLLTRYLPSLRSPAAALIAPGTAAAIAFAVTAALKLVTADLPTVVAALLTVGIGGFTYVVVAFRTGVREADMVLRPARRVIWR
ncbi:MAG: murein biosynthesis integral membrane protein MurJ [Acidimicrobiales bacterium]|nr:murein biosynthesis integral membrane protein MurJ [Acidimicrobiales bacterium]